MVARKRSPDLALLEAIEEAGRDEFFDRGAFYRPDAPENSPYAIRVGSRHLYSDCTWELRKKFNRFVGRLRTRRTRGLI